MVDYKDDFSKILEELYKIMVSKGEPFRARAYKKAKDTINTIDEPIKNVDMLKGRTGIGETIVKKLTEFVDTGKVGLIEKEKSNPVNIFTDIYGIGPKKAIELVKTHDIKTIDELRKNQHLLNDKQVMGLKYYEDILLRIPRREIEEYQTKFASVFKDLGNYEKDKTTFEIVGSYRRGAKDSGDIDVIITGNKSLFKDFVDKLLNENIIIEVLSRGPTKSLVIGKLKDSSKARRIDFLYSTPEEYPFSILYFTGSASFNTVMRQMALNKGYTLNEHGIYHMKNGKKGDKVKHTFKTEMDIFDFLDMEFKEPIERKDGNAVILKKEKSTISEMPKDSQKSSKSAKTSKSIKKKKLVIVDKFDVDHIKEFTTVGITYLKSLKKRELEGMLRYANKTYYNSTPILSDNMYDILKEYVEKLYPKSSVLHEIGAPLEIEKEKVKLPYFMGSMDKIKPDTNALKKYKSKFPGSYTLSAKLDGVSALYVYDKEGVKLYTRGNGEYGQDITYLLPYLNMPKKFLEERTDKEHTCDKLVIRGELIMKKNIYDKKYKDKASNPRNLVAGIINSKKSATKDKFKDIDFVAYELIEPVLSIDKQIEFMETYDILKKIIIVMNKQLKKEKLTNEYLSEILIKWRDDYMYEIDGIIVSHNGIYERKKGNPEHSLAFKMVLSDQVVEAKVLNVIWTPSKDGYLKPRVQIEPVNIGGAKIEYATGFNGSFILNNKIGIGAQVTLVRSGDVIPHIMSVTKPATEAKMPDVDYVWNDSGVDIILTDKDEDDTVKAKNITGFFVGLDIKGVGPGNIKQLIKGGYDTVDKILNVSIDDLMKLDGFQKKKSEKIYHAIKKGIDEANIIQILSASNILGRGFGKERLKKIFKEFPNILHEKSLLKEENIANISTISGFSIKTATSFVERIDNINEFLERVGLMYKYDDYIYDTKTSPSKTEVSKTKGENKLEGMNIILTGFRSSELEREIEKQGGTISGSVSKKTDFVIVRDLDEDTGKAVKARKLGVSIILEDEFKEKYGL